MYIYVTFNYINLNIIYQKNKRKNRRKNYFTFLSPCKFFKPINYHLINADKARRFYYAVRKLKPDLAKNRRPAIKHYLYAVIRDKIDAL